MKDTRSIEEQVAELTEKQKDTIVRVGIWGTVIFLVTAVPPLLLFILGAVIIVTDSLLMTEAAFFGWGILGAITFVVLIAYLIIIKTAFPYYSDKKAKYIMKSRKGKKKADSKF